MKYNVYMEPGIECRGLYHGYKYCVVVVPMGFRCGYVRIPPYHPLDPKIGKDLDFDVHGGLTFSGQSTYFDKNDWTLGFDAGHYGDGTILTSRGVVSTFLDGEVRSLEYMQTECYRLIDQIIKEYDVPQYTLKKKVRFKV